MECVELREVVLNDGLKKICSHAFYECKGLEYIAILPSTISDYAFQNCRSLREVVLNEGLKMIGCHVFDGCTALESITIPTTVDDINASAFMGCTHLQTVVLKEGIKRIKTDAFGECTSLRSVELPSTISKISQNAFRSCRTLREVVIHNEEIQIDDKAFIRCSSKARFKFPSLSTRINNIIQVGHPNIKAKINDIPAVEWRGGELIIPVKKTRAHLGLGSETLIKVDEEKLTKVKGLIVFYEVVKEAIIIFELALWKSRIDQADLSSPSDRRAYRIEVPGPAKDTILQYLRGE